MRIATIVTLTTNLVFATCALGSLTAWGGCYQKSLQANEVQGVDQASAFFLRWNGIDRVNNMALAEPDYPTAKADFHCDSDARCSLNGIGMYFSKKGDALELKINGSFGLTQEGDSTIQDLSLFADGKTDWTLIPVPDDKCHGVFAVHEPSH